MPSIEINGANIYYQAYGDEPSANRAPILLIHGSTIDSHTDWDSIAPELALPMALMRRMQQRANTARDLTAALDELRGWRAAMLGDGFASHLRALAGRASVPAV